MTTGLKLIDTRRTGKWSGLRALAGLCEFGETAGAFGKVEGPTRKYDVWGPPILSRFYDRATHSILIIRLTLMGEAPKNQNQLHRFRAGISSLPAEQQKQDRGRPAWDRPR